jgi:hypothetical protein
MEQLVYVRVLGFSGGLLQPVRALHVHDGCYRLLEASDDPDHDHWEFGAPDLVRCETTAFGEGEEGLIAVAICD